MNLLPVKLSRTLLALPAALLCAALSGAIIALAEEAKPKPSEGDRFKPVPAEKSKEGTDTAKDEAGSSKAGPPAPKQSPGREEPRGDSTAAVNAAEAKPAGKADSEPDEGPPLPSPEHSEDLLPSVAEEQPGFIPDVSPKDLTTQPPPAGDIAIFESPLRNPLLPTQSAEELISRYDGNPGFDLDDNFARVVVPRGSIRGSTETKQFQITGGLKVFYNDVIMSGDSADIDEKQETAVIRGNVSIVDPQYTLKTDQLVVYFGDKRFEATGFVQFNKNPKPGQDQPNFSLGKKDRLREYFAGQRFELYCSKLFYDWESKEMLAVQGVRIVHPSFNGTLEQLGYNDKTKVYEMSGQVQLEATDYEWIFSNKLGDDKDEKKIRAITKQPTTITCDRLKYSEETGVAEFYANSGGTVKFDQTQRIITGAYIEVNDKTKDFYAEGNEGAQARYEQTDGTWLYEAELISRDQTSDDLSKALEGQVTADAGSITFNYDRKRLEMRDGIKISAATKTITANELVQDDTAKYFLLNGNVTVKPDEDSEIYAAQIYVDTANDVFTFVGLVQGKFNSDDVKGLVPEANAPGSGPGGVSGSPTGAPAAGLFQQQGPLPPGQRQASRARKEDAGEKDKKDGANVAEGRR